MRQGVKDVLYCQYIQVVTMFPTAWLIIVNMRGRFQRTPNTNNAISLINKIFKELLK